MKMFIKSKGEAGITLIELCVVMAIIAIMAVFMVPSIGEWVQNYRIKQAARNVASDLQAAKMQAINIHKYCTVVFNANGYVIFPDYNNNMVLDTGSETTDIYKTVVFSTEYKTVNFDTSAPTTGTDSINDGITFTNNTIAFDSRGLPRDTNGSYTGGIVYLVNTKNNKYRSITVSNAGAIIIAEYP